MGKKKTTKGKLNPRQQRFCEEYIIDLNATQAALRAGYCARTVNQTGPKKLVKVGIQNEIARLKSERSERTLIKADDVVLELAKIGFSNIEDYLTVDEDGETHLKSFDDIERSVLAAIESIKISTTKNKDDSREYTTTQFKLCSKLNALEQLGKHLGIYQKDNEQKGQTIFDILAIVGVNLGNSDNRTKAISGTVG
jgi:phage terminase small subunit